MSGDNERLLTDLACINSVNLYRRQVICHDAAKELKLLRAKVGYLNAEIDRWQEFHRSEPEAWVVVTPDGGCLPFNNRAFAAYHVRANPGFTMHPVGTAVDLDLDECSECNATGWLCDQHGIGGCTFCRREGLSESGCWACTPPGGCGGTGQLNPVFADHQTSPLLVESETPDERR